MANKRQSTGKGRVVTPAPKRANGKSTTTKRTRKPASVRTAMTRANAINAEARVRQFVTDDGVADYFDALPLITMPASIANDPTIAGAIARREWCLANGIKAVPVYDDGFVERRVGRPRNKQGWRPEAGIRQRIASISRINPDGFGYTRAEPNGKQLATVLALAWDGDDGLPSSFAGADRVFIYRV